MDAFLFNLLIFMVVIIGGSCVISHYPPLVDFFENAFNKVNKMMERWFY